MDTSKKKITIDKIISYLRANEEDIAEAFDIDYDLEPKFLEPLLETITTLGHKS